MTDPTPPASGAPWLPDRASFEGALGSHLVRRPGQSAVFVLELKDLADIAGTYGVAMAAAIVTEAGHRFFEIAKRGSGGTLAQLGDARFITFVPGVANRDQAFRLARQLCRDMVRPLNIQSLRLALTFCLGVSYSEDHRETAAELIDQAETEMLADLIVAAHADAKRKLDDIQAAEMQDATGGIALPDGFKLPF